MVEAAGVEPNPGPCASLRESYIYPHKQRVNLRCVKARGTEPFCCLYAPSRTFFVRSVRNLGCRVNIPPPHGFAWSGRCLDGWHASEKLDGELWAGRRKSSRSLNCHP
jgi:hypothetical protein